MDAKRRLLSFYGDDFTGSTDAMEALENGGLKTVLFLEPPTKELLDEEFPDVQCIGVAGISRTMNPERMEIDLKPILEQIKELGAPVNHYKICSTFDSSPDIGSIGKVLEMILEMNKAQQYVPIIAGAPPLGRYTVFGNHFAKVGDDIFRLDKHPVMSRHPITPMQEADLLKHLSKQTNDQLSSINVNFLDDDISNMKAETNEIVDKEGSSGVLFDALTDRHLMSIGNLLWEESKKVPLFVIGSSGVEYALQNYWGTCEEKGTIRNKEMEQIKKEQVLVVSGSCSPVTSEQIEHGLKNEFTGLKISVAKLIQPETAAGYLSKLVNDVVEIANEGKDLIIYSALGPEDSSIKKTREYLMSIGEDTSKSGQLLGEKLGKLIKKAVEKTSLKRVVIAGGDTSSYATLEMGVYALEMIARIAPGAPLCKCYSEDTRFDGLELALKGGQLGGVDYFSKVHEGSSEERL